MNLTRVKYFAYHRFEGTVHSRFCQIFGDWNKRKEKFHDI